MPYSLPCVLRIPVIAVTMLLSLWWAVDPPASQAKSITGHQTILLPDLEIEMASATENIDIVAPQAASPPISITMHPASPEMLQAYFGAPGQGRQRPLGPALLVTKTVGVGPGCAQSNFLVVAKSTQIYYCYVAFNVGTTTLYTHTIVDDPIGVLASAYFHKLPPNSDKSGAFFTLPTTTTSSIRNLVSWQALDENDVVVEATAAAQVVVPTIALTATLGSDPETCGQEAVLSTLPATTISICYIVENTSLVTLTGHTLYDSNHGLLLEDDPEPLAPGATRTVKQTMLVTQSSSSIITWTATTTNLVSAEASSRTTVQVPSIELQTTVGAGTTDCPVTDTITVTFDSMVTLCYIVQNTGGFPLNKHALSNTLQIYPPISITLEPGASLGITVTLPATDTIRGVGEWRASGPKGLLAIAQDVFTVAIRSDAVIEVYAFYDVDGQGDLEPMEPGLAGVEILLESPSGRQYTVTTDQRGIAHLEGMPETGDYTTTVNTTTIPIGYRQTTSMRSVPVKRGQVVSHLIGFSAPEGTDTDQDTIADKDERADDFDGDELPNYLDLDSDNDGLPDRFEGHSDTNFDGQPNRLDPTRFLFLPSTSR